VAAARHSMPGSQKHCRAQKNGRNSRSGRLPVWLKVGL